MFIKTAVRVGQWVLRSDDAVLDITANRAYLVVATINSFEKRRMSKFNSELTSEDEFLFHDDSGDLRFGVIRDGGPWEPLNVDMGKHTSKVKSDTVAHLLKQKAWKKEFLERTR